MSSGNILQSLLTNNYMCEFCKDLENLEREYPEEPFHGAVLVCDECGAEYYEPYNRPILNTNDQAKLSHPELKSL